MNKLRQLDELIMEVMREKNLVEKETQKGGVEGGDEVAKGEKHLNLNLAEILSILSLGTEHGKDVKSAIESADMLVKAAGFQRNFDNPQGLVDSFKFLDIQHEKVMTAKCSSIGGLVSKYALAGSLVSIFEQFNPSAGGFVNENFLGKIMGGEAVTAGTAGIEDIKVKTTQGLIGISLKTKKGTDVQGSITQLLETIGLSFYAEPIWQEKSLKSGKAQEFFQYEIAGSPKLKSRVKFLDGTIQNRKNRDVHFWTREAGPIVDKLFYMFFSKGEEKGKTSRSLKISAVEITPEDIIGHLGSEDVKEINGVPHYNIRKVKNIIAGSLAQLMDSVKTRGEIYLESDFSIEGYNETLKQNAGDVYESLMTLDAWFGGLKEKLIGYVSNLEKTSFDDMQAHLSNGVKFAFKAFDVQSCQESS